MPRSMIVKRFVHEEDVPVLNEWLKIRGMKYLDPKELPAIGFIVFDGETAICAAFLRRCEGNLGFIEGLASNPDIPGPIRHIAIDGVVSRVIQEAKDREMTNLMAWSVDTSTLERSAKHGFKKLQQTLIAKDLTEELLVN